MAQHQQPPPIEVAVLLADDKERKLRLIERAREAKLDDVRFTRVGLEDLLASGDRYRVVLHKIHADLTSSEPAAADRVARFKAWLARRGAGLVALDPLAGLESMLLYRLDQCRSMAMCADSEELRPRVYVPRFALIAQPGGEAVDAAGQLSYPLLCKPHVASGAEAHNMTLVFTPEQLAEAVRPGEPVVAQEFVNHGARLIKVYVLGDAIHACVRPSVRDFPPGHAGPAISFSSHAVSKAGCRSELSATPPSADATDAAGDDRQLVERYQSVLRPLALRCRQVLGLDLINLDLVPDRASGRLALVDINQFPGFEAMPDFVGPLAQLVRRKCLT